MCQRTRDDAIGTQLMQFQSLCWIRNLTLPPLGCLWLDTGEWLAAWCRVAGNGVRFLTAVDSLDLSKLQWFLIHRRSKKYRTDSGSVWSFSRPGIVVKSWPSRITPTQPCPVFICFYGVSGGAFERSHMEGPCLEPSFCQHVQPRPTYPSVPSTSGPVVWLLLRAESM